MARLALALPAALAVVALAPVASGGDPTCEVRAEPGAVPVLDDHYVYQFKGTGLSWTVELWLESNQVDGLQRHSTQCFAGDAWGPDTLRLSLPVAPFEGIRL